MRSREIGRDGRVHVWVDGQDGAARVRVGGTACFVREMAVDGRRG